MAKITHIEVTQIENGKTETYVLENSTNWQTVVIGDDAKEKAPGHVLDKNLKFKPKPKSGAELEVAAVAVMTKEPDVCTWDGTKWVCSGS